MLPVEFTDVESTFSTEILLTVNQLIVLLKVLLPLSWHSSMGYLLCVVLLRKITQFPKTSTKDVTAITRFYLQCKHVCLYRSTWQIFNLRITLWSLDQTHFIAVCIIPVFHLVKPSNKPCLMGHYGTISTNVYSSTCKLYHTI